MKTGWGRWSWMRRGQERERSQALEEAGRGVVSFFFLTRADPLTRAEGQKGAGEAYVRWGRGGGGRRRSAPARQGWWASMFSAPGSVAGGMHAPFGCPNTITCPLLTASSSPEDAVWKRNHFPSRVPSPGESTDATRQLSDSKLL